MKDKTKVGKIIQFLNGFLNSYKGGTILFDCKSSPFGFTPIGVKMT